MSSTVRINSSLSFRPLLDGLRQWLPSNGSRALNWNVVLRPTNADKWPTLAAGVELWVTGWDEPFTLSPDDGFYDEFEYRRVNFLIRKTIPPGWNLR
jgi:hypothetical protein